MLTKVLPISAVMALTLASGSLPASAQMGPMGQGPGGPASQDMRRCVGGVLSQLGRSQAPETQVGPTIVKQCDKQLRATLQEAITSGHAANCTVDSCLALARQRTTEEATAAYRQSFLSR